MAYNFKNLVFEDGGVKGIAYVGALEVLSKKQILDQVIRVGGISAGAINAILIGLGYTLDETREILWGLDFNNLIRRRNNFNSCYPRNQAITVF